MFDKILEIEKFNNIGITGLTNELISFSVSNIYKKTNRDILVVTNSLYEANVIYQSLSKLNDNCYLFFRKLLCKFVKRYIIRFTVA